ncbi:uncharacterized protein WM277_024403 [Molossus nigricans]
MIKHMLVGKVTSRSGAFPSRYLKRLALLKGRAVNSGVSDPGPCLLALRLHTASSGKAGNREEGRGAISNTTSVVLLPELCRTTLGDRMERKVEERETSMSESTEDRARNPSMCPNQESNWQPFGAWEDANQLSHASQGLASALLSWLLAPEKARP